MTAINSAALRISSIRPTARPGRTELPSGASTFVPKIRIQNTGSADSSVPPPPPKPYFTASVNTAAQRPVAPRSSSGSRTAGILSQPISVVSAAAAMSAPPAFSPTQAPRFTATSQSFSPARFAPADLPKLRSVTLAAAAMDAPPAYSPAAAPAA